MATFDLSGIDMNNATNISIYTQLIRLQEDIFETEIQFTEPAEDEKFTIHTLARRLGLVFEYSISPAVAQVSKPALKDLGDADGVERMETWDGHVGTGLNDYAELQDMVSPWPKCHMNSDIHKWLPPSQAWHLGPSFDDYLTRQPDYHQVPSVYSDLSISASSPSSGAMLSPSEQSSSWQDSPKRYESVEATTPSRRSSMDNTMTSTKSGYVEIVFDWYSERSRSATPLPSNTRGPMDTRSRAAMKAVKAVGGACWRCKFLRKTCNNQTPCTACPKSSPKSKQSSWEALGCKRGSLQGQVPELKLCPNAGLVDVSLQGEQESSRVTIPSHERPNTAFKNHLKTRDIELARIKASECPQNEFFKGILGKTDTSGCWKPLHKLQWSVNSCQTCDPFLPPVLEVLDECIVSILWEVCRSKSARVVYIEDSSRGSSTLWDLAVFLRSVASYQTRVKDDRLVYLSLVCLRSSLEVLHIKSSDHLRDSDHESCDEASCKVDCVSALRLHFEAYLGEVQRVFFKKENLRNKEPWWLSAFYSLCIHGMIRNILLQCVVLTVPESSLSDTVQYLHLVVQLFTASSGSYDPLIRDYSVSNRPEASTAAKPPRTQDFQEAQLLLKQRKWTSMGTRGSAEYLQQLYGFPSEPCKMIDKHEDTPTTLGWSPIADYLKLYKFILKKGVTPYLELENPHSVSRKTPLRVYLDVEKGPKKGVYCQYPLECSRKYEPFSRPADLERHYRNVHTDPSERDKFFCDYENCPRRDRAFTRKDHCRDHFRDFHGEPLGMANGARGLAAAAFEAAMEEWIASRKIHKNWWRCPKCLSRVDIAKSQYTCKACNSACEPHVEAAIEAARMVASELTPP